MAGERALSKIQYGKETTRGTAVAATKILNATAQPIPPDRRPVRPEVNVGVRSNKVFGYIPTYLVRDTLRLSHGYYQALPMMFGCGLKGGVTASEVTPSQGDYRWDFTPSWTAANSPDSLTIEKGDDTQAFEAEYCMFERIRISGTIPQDGGDAPVSIEADYFARQWTATTFTGSLSLTTPEYINAKLARLYIDTAWASVGTTEKTLTLRGFQVDLLTGVHPKMMGSGNKYFDTYGESFIDFTAAFTFEGNSTADAIWDAQQALTLNVVRLQIKGAQIGSGDYHTLTLDLGGYWEDVIPLAQQVNGNNLHTAVLIGHYNPTGAKVLDVDVITNSNTY